MSNIMTWTPLSRIKNPPQRVYWDTNTIVALYTPNDPYHEDVRLFHSHLLKLNIDNVLTVPTINELRHVMERNQIRDLGKSFKIQSDYQRARHVSQLTQCGAGLAERQKTVEKVIKLVRTTFSVSPPISPVTLLDSVEELRAKSSYEIGVADLNIVAEARANGCNVIVSYDNDFQGVPELEIIKPLFTSCVRNTLVFK